MEIRHEGEVVNFTFAKKKKKGIFSHIQVTFFSNRAMFVSSDYRSEIFHRNKILFVK